MSHFTPFEEVNRLLSDLLENVRAILGDELAGFYIDGSLALGGFNPSQSDVDFLVATNGPLADRTVISLVQMHRRLANSGWPLAQELEGSYIPARALRRYEPNDATHPNLERGPGELLKHKQHHSDWIIHRYIVREHGLTLFGPPPAELIDPISPEDLRAATVGTLRSWWATEEAENSIRRGHPGYWAYVVQTMCRARYTLVHGTVSSKPVAWQWASATLDERWRPLIMKASRWEVEAADVDETLRFVHNIIRQWNSG